MATKILGLDALEHIRDYIDGASLNINYRIDTELKTHIEDKIAEASTSIQTNYDDKYNKLVDRIQYVEQHGSAEELAELQLQLDALNADTQEKFSALDGINRELNKLTVDYQEMYKGVTTGTIFSAGQLNEIINTAMINKVDISPDAILTPEMYAAKLVALIGNFGQINAANIIGGDIKGHTISSNNLIEGTEDPVWTIREAGDGWLAQKNISWDANGNVTFGENVKISFDNVTGAEAKLQSLMSNYDGRLQSYVEDYVKNSSVATVDRQMLQDALDAAKSDVDTAMSELEKSLNDSIDGKVTTANTALTNAVNKVEAYFGADYAVEGATLKAQLDAVKTAAEEAAKSGNEELAKQLNDLSGDLNREIDALNISYVEVRNSVKAIESDIQNMGGTALNQKGLEDLLDASLIQSTTQTGDSIISPNVIAKKLVALVATFGTVNASRIVGTDIQGYTISSPRAKKDSEGNIIYKEDEYEYAIDAQGNKIQAVDANNRPLWDAQGNPIYVYAIDANGDKIPVPDTVAEEDLAWILRSDGTGHLANGNISWNDGGDLTVAGTINGNIGKSSGDAIGPWNTIIDNDATYIGDKTTLADSSNYFGDNGLFKIGGNNGIKSETNGVISIGSSDSGMTVKSDGAIEFGSNVKLAWSNVDAPTDLATQAYVQENGFTTEIAEDWIKTADITCENIKVAKVDTTPKSDGDKVTISGNTIQVLNDNEQPGISISNNNINFNYKPEKLNEVCIYEGSNAFINLGNIVNANGAITNKEPLNSNAVCEIGALDYGATFNLYVATTLTNGLVIDTNSYSYSTKTDTCPFVTIYKYNDNTNMWEHYKEIACTSWDKVTMINGATTTGSSTMYRFVATNTGEILDRGIYAVGLSIPSNGIIFTAKPSGIVQMRVDFRIDTIKREMSSFVDIGKNGIVINSENGNIYMDNSNIVMSMGTSKSMYGIKITPVGMYYCNGDSTWTPWNPSN